jgi:hypothetical protein
MHYVTHQSSPRNNAATTPTAEAGAVKTIISNKLRTSCITSFQNCITFDYFKSFITHYLIFYNV